MRNILEVRGIRKKYGHKTILNIVQHRFGDGITWIQGKNGSGKSTLLKILTGLLDFEGEVMLGPLSVKRHPTAYRRLIGFSESEARFPPFVTGADLVALFMEAKQGNPKPTAQFAADLGMNDFLPYPVQEYSAGMVKKLSLLLAFIGNPKYILLDEPFITLDNEAMYTLSRWIGHANDRGINFVLTSHQPLPGGTAANAEWLLINGQLANQDQT